MNTRVSRDELLTQKERYSAFITQSTEGIWRFELEQPISVTLPVSKQIKALFQLAYLAECNDVMAKMYGYKRASDLIGTRLNKLLIPSNKDNIHYLTAFITSGYKLTNAISHEVDKFGQTHIFENNLIGIIDNQYLLRAWGTQRDVTKQKQLEERQQFLESLSNKLMLSFSQNITLAEIAKLMIPYLADYCRIALVDQHKQITEVAVHHKNPNHKHLAQQLYNAYIENPDVPHGIHHILTTGKPEIISNLSPDSMYSIKHNRKMQKIISQIKLKSYMGVPLIARDKVIGAMTFSSIHESRIYTKDHLRFAQEIAHRIALAIDNTRLFREAQEAIRIRDDFISVASHELKTPLTSIKIFTQILEQHAEKTKDRTALPHLQKVNKQLKKLTELIYDLLDISRIQKGKIQLTKSIFNFDDTVRDVIEVMQTWSKHKIRIQGYTNAMVYGDQDRIGQVISNLVSNAIKYSPKSFEIIIHLSKTKKNVEVGVQDFGIGIPAQHISRIFSRFYRVFDTTDKTYPGLGIGLYISAQIIARHHGKIWVKSSDGKGSTFYFSLPIESPNR